MRTLLLMRGAPGAGKSTWIKEHNLEEYTLCPDNIRILCSSTELQPTGDFQISQNRDNEAVVWEVLFKLLEHRMSRGEFTVIDATCSKTKDIQQYKDLADAYRYRMFIIDFTDIPLEVCLQQNLQRPSWKHVPEESIKNIYARFKTQKIPGGVKILKRNEFDSLLEAPIDLSHFAKVVMIGDIHGCFDTLMQYDDFQTGLRDDTCYIFCGDFVDRGNQNAETLLWLDAIKDKSNVCLLEGNHERWIQAFGNNVPAKSKPFEFKTKPELYAKGYDEKMARMLYRKVRQFSHFTYNGVEVLACHAGIPNLKTNLLYLPACDFIHGVGAYKDYLEVTDSWMQQTSENQYLVHGHRNVEASETHIADRVFNLEGRVEFGGALRIVELQSTAAGIAWNVIELENRQPITSEIHTEEHIVDTVSDAVKYLRNNRMINEKILGDDISSFNFSRDAFYKANWNKQTILARGLFINTATSEIVARSYEKFFKINEVYSTELAALRDRLVFPVSAYVKENGFLAIVSYNKQKDELFVASKSTNQGPYVEFIKAQLEPVADDVLNYLRSRQDLTLVFECIDVKNDPHIIKYAENHLVLLDAIYNDLEFRKIDYIELTKIARQLNVEVKEKAFELKDWDAFRELYNRVQDEEYRYKETYIEGFVFEDSAGFMTKCKSGYYNLWKKLRGVAHQTLKVGYITKTGMLTSSIENIFYGFCKEFYNQNYHKETKSYDVETDIITLRDKFYEFDGVER